MQLTSIRHESTLQEFIESVNGSCDFATFIPQNELIEGACMTNILIQPIAAVTVDGYPVQLMAISVGPDYLIGNLTSASGQFVAAWDQNGTCRGQSDGSNLLMDDEIRETIKTAKQVFDR